MSSVDSRLRLLVNPGSINYYGAGNNASNYDELLDLTNKAENEWLPALRNLLGSDEKAKAIANLLHKQFSNGANFGYYCGGRLDVEAIDKYIKDACANGGFKMNNGSRTLEFNKTEFASDLGAALNQLNLTGVIAYSIDTINTSLDADKTNKLKYIRDLEVGYYALRDHVLNDIIDPADSIQVKFGSWISKTQLLANYISEGKLPKVVVNNMKEVDANYNKNEPIHRALKRLYGAYFNNNFTGPIEKTNESPLKSDADMDRRAAIVVEQFKDDMAEFLRVRTSYIDSTMNAYASSHKPKR